MNKFIYLLFFCLVGCSENDKTHFGTVIELNNDLSLFLIKDVNSRSAMCNINKNVEILIENKIVTKKELIFWYNTNKMTSKIRVVYKTNKHDEVFWISFSCQ